MRAPLRIWLCSSVIRRFWATAAACNASTPGCASRVSCSSLSTSPNDQCCALSCGRLSFVSGGWQGRPSPATKSLMTALFLRSCSMKGATKSARNFGRARHDLTDQLKVLLHAEIRLEELAGHALLRDTGRLGAAGSDQLRAELRYGRASNRQGTWRCRFDRLGCRSCSRRCRSGSGRRSLGRGRVRGH